MNEHNGQHEDPCITIPMMLVGVMNGPSQIRIKEVSLTAVPAANDVQRWQLAAALCLEASKMCVEEMRKVLQNPSGIEVARDMPKRMK